MSAKDAPEATGSGTTSGEAALERVLRLSGPRETAPADRVARVRAAVHDEWRETVSARSRRQWFLVGGLGLAAAAALVLAVRRPAPPPSEQPAPRQASARVQASGAGVTIAGSGVPLTAGLVLDAGSGVSTPADRYATVVLEGGGEVRIDGGTAVTFLGDRRIALAHGAIYLDVTSNGASAVRVETREGTVRDIGTRFEVRVSAHGSRIRVRDGAIRLDRAGASHEAAAGTQLFVPLKGAVESVRITEYDDEWRWTVLAAPSFPVEGRTLEAFLEWASREGGRRVVFADPSLESRLRNTVLHGSIDGLSVDEALEVILPTCGLAHRLDGSTVVVLQSPEAGGAS